MNREDGVAIVEPGDLLDVGPVEEKPAQRRCAGVADDPRWQDQPDSSTRSHELQRPFDKQLVPVGMRPGFDGVDAGCADEIRQAASIGPPIATGLLFSAVAANHVPRRVADDGVESATCQRHPISAAKHLRKRERPVEKAMTRRHRVGMFEERRR